MADRTFESQALGAQLTQQAGQEVAAAAGNLGQGVAAGMESLNRRQQVAEERDDRNRQFDQQAEMEGRKVSAIEKQSAQQASMFEQELAQNREKFAMERVREERFAKADAVRIAREEIDNKKREREFQALSAISADQLAQAEIDRFKIENETAKLNLDLLKRQASGEPSVSDRAKWLQDPETQVNSGMRYNYQSGKFESLTPEQISSGKDQLSRREVARTFDILVKSTAEFAPEMAGKIAIVSAKLARGAMTIEQAEAEIDRITDDHGASISDDGKVTKAVEKAVGDIRLQSIKEDGPVGQGNAPRVLAYFDQNADEITRWLGSTGDPKRQKKYSRDEAFREFSDAVSNPFNPIHGAVVNALRAFDVIPPAQQQGGMVGLQKQMDEKFLNDKLSGKK